MPRLSAMVRKTILDRNEFRDRLDTFRRDDLSIDDLMKYLKDLNYGRQYPCTTAKYLIGCVVEATALYFSRLFDVPEFSHRIEVGNTDRADKSN